MYGLILYGPLSVSVGAVIDSSKSNSLKTAPLPDKFDAPVVQVYAARTWGKKGMLAVHTWIVTKRLGANSYNRHEIVG